MALMYFYCAAVKHDLLKSAIVTMPDEVKHDGESDSHLYTPSRRKRDNPMATLKRALEQPIRIEETAEAVAITRVKRQKV